MSDSDDTDILLWIPPDYYINTAENKLLHDISKKEVRASFSFDSQQLNESRCLPSSDHIQYSVPLLTMNSDMASESAGLTSLSISSLIPPSCKMDFIHSNIDDLSKMENGEVRPFDNISEISSISLNTVCRNVRSKVPSNPASIMHSTPKYGNDRTLCNQGLSSMEDLNSFNNKSDTINKNYWKQSYNNKNCNTHCKNWLDEQQQLPKQLNDDCKDYDISQSDNSDVRGKYFASEQNRQSSCSYHVPKTDPNLISLSEIWGKNSRNTAITMPVPSRLKEEQLRRQHLEKTVRQLQERLLEYQQCLSVAVEVDRTKDVALKNTQLENTTLRQDLQQVRQQLNDIEQDRRQHEDQLDTLRKELAQAVNLASKFQEKNENLEAELTIYSKRQNDSYQQYKQKIEDLEIKLQACKRSEELIINEMHRLKDKFAKSEHLYEKAKLRSDDLEKENVTLRHQKETLHDFHQKQKTRSDHLENQKKSLQQSVAHLTEIETNLKKKLELQQSTLKSHYQQQLESVVAQKLKEFQEQMDRTEDTLKSEARERERLIADRAVKQLELINEKNELELRLMQEKHIEEVELYRIQLSNATKKIDELDTKLHALKTKRVYIAEQLHSVMQTQWQKALEILTAPNRSKITNQADTTDTETPDNAENHKSNDDAIIDYTISTAKNDRKENNFNVQKNNQINTSPIDKLQAYIELLLSKSPSDFDKLDEILSLSAKTAQYKDKIEKYIRKQNNNKPPWKA